MHIFQFTLPILQLDSMILRSHPFSKGGTPFGLELHTSGIEPECMKLILGLVFQIGGLGVSETRATSIHDTCQPQLLPPPTT